MSIWSEKGLFPQSKTQNFHLLVCQRHDFLAQPGVVVIMCFFHCPGSNGTTTCYCRETDNVANTRFLGHFCTPTMLHLRAFVANQVLSPIRAYFGLFCPDFYSDIADFTQIFCRYLPKKLVAKTSGYTPKSAKKKIATDKIRKVVFDHLPYTFQFLEWVWGCST